MRLSTCRVTGQAQMLATVAGHASLYVKFFIFCSFFYGENYQCNPSQKETSEKPFSSDMQAWKRISWLYLVHQTVLH